MKTIVLKGTKREAFGKKESKSLRRAESIPCAIYGSGDTIHFSVNEKEVKPLIYTPNSYIVEIDLGENKEVGVIREVQYHPVKEQILHMDFYRITNDKEFAIDVPIKIVGNSEGVKQGGKLQVSKRKLKVKGKVDKMPDELVIDITTLALGKSIFVGDLNFDGLTILTPATTAVCAVRMTRAARGAAAADAK